MPPELQPEETVTFTEIEQLRLQVSQGELNNMQANRQSAVLALKLIDMQLPAAQGAHQRLLDECVAAARARRDEGKPAAPIDNLAAPGLNVVRRREPQPERLGLSKEASGQEAAGNAA